MQQSSYILCIFSIFLLIATRTNEIRFTHIDNGHLGALEVEHLVNEQRPFTFSFPEFADSSSLLRFSK